MIARPPSTVDVCADALRTLILRDLQPGSGLPPERRLAGQLGVNRTTLRSALSRLTTEGLLDVRQGRGYAVRDYRRSAGPDLIGQLAEIAIGRRPQELLMLAEDLLIVRRQLAGAVLDKLTVRRQRGPIDVTAFDAALVLLAAAVDRNASKQELATADVSTMREVIALTESAVLMLCFNPVAQILSTLPALRDAMYDEPQSNVTGYMALRHWLSDPDWATDGSTILKILAARDVATLRRMADSLDLDPNSDR